MSSTLSPQAALSMVRQNFRKLGLDLPATLTDDLTKIDQTLERAASLGEDTTTLPAAVFDALAAGKEPTGAKVMQEALLIQLKAMNIKARLGEEADRRRAQALTSATGALVAAMAPVIEEADDAFAEARDTIPHLDLDPAVAAGLPAAHMEAWGRARDALARADLVMATWGYIVPADRWSNDRRRYLPLILADLTLEELRAIRLKSVTTDLALAGHRLSLATAEVYRDRLARVTAEDAEQRERAAQDAEHYARTGYTKATHPVALRIPGGARP